MTRQKIQFYVLLAGALALAGCDSYQPLEVTPNSEIRPGPGLFTGERGAFYIVGDQRQIPQDEPPPQGEN